MLRRRDTPPSPNTELFELLAQDADAHAANGASFTPVVDPIDEDLSGGLDGPIPMRRAAEDGGRAPQKEKPSPTSEPREDRGSRLQLTGICRSCKKRSPFDEPQDS